MHVLTLYTFFLVFLTYTNCNNDPHVIVVGAGAAGIAAATKLYKNGIKNITILEAENRIGGRIYSIKFEDSYIDLGAQWCHGEKNNIVYSLVKDLDILKDDEIMPSFYHSKLKLVDKEFSLKLMEIFDTLYNQDYRQPEMSLGEVLTEGYNKVISETWKGEEDKIRLAQDCLDLFDRWVMSYDGAFSWFNLSSENSYQVSEGNLQLGWNGLGYRTILEVLMQKFPKSKEPLPIEDKIILNKEVTQINWNKNVVVKCSDGTSYTGDHVISTVSLGVLKDQYKILFQPDLSNEKVTAIQVLGINAVGKIMLHFPNKWWDENFPGASFVWSAKELEKTADAFPEGPNKGGKSWITSVLSIITVSKSPNLLSAWFGGELLPEIENLSSETILSGLMYLLDNFLGEDYQNITRPDKIIRNNWYNNKHFRGTYSFDTPASQKLLGSRDILAEPLKAEGERPVVLFAGEATNPIHYSTVHGAIESGFREADRLINLYK